MPSAPARGEAATHGTAPDRPAPPLRRPARDADSAGLIALIGGCWAEYPGCVLDVDGEEPWLRAPATAYAGKGGELWVVELAGELVASVGLVPAGAGQVELKSLYVAKPGRRQGLGAELVGVVETAARQRGVGTVRLWSDTQFGDAHRLYRRLGYRRTGRTRDLHDRSNTTEYEFVRRLG
jgi:GNAT superfamily N-acetyltransferase